MHGFALNCNNSLEPYDHIIACGIKDAGVTTISRMVGHDVKPADLIAPITAQFETVWAVSA